MMWAVMGVGMLFNAIQQSSQAAQMREMQQSQQAEMQKMMKQMTSQQQAMNDTPFQNLLSIQTGLPEYPQENFANLQDMQMGHMDARANFTAELDKDLQTAKTAFFQDNHYETELGADGRQQVAMNQEGEPQVKFGGENGDQRTTRLAFEGEKKAELKDTHTTQKEQFLSKEKENFKDFLAMNRERLDNPYVHGELQRMVVASKKKSLELQQNQEDERWRADMPPSEEIAVKLDNGLKKLHAMDQEHMQAEENSDDMKALIDHDEKVASILYDHKQRAQQEQSEENLTMDPRKMMAMAQQRREPKDVGKSLPSYLTNAMYELGVYSV